MTKTIDTGLLIGGSRDGQRRNALYGSRITFEGPSETYTRHSIHGGDWTVSYWVVAGMTPEEALQRLFDLYGVPKP